MKSWKYRLSVELEGEKNMSGENLRDVGLPLEEEVRREMFSSMDRIIKEIKERFDQLLH